MAEVRAAPHHARLAGLGPARRLRAGRSRSSRSRTSRSTTPRRCRRCSTDRSRWARSSSRVRWSGDRRRGCCSSGTVPCQMLHIQPASRRQVVAPGEPPAVPSRRGRRTPTRPRSAAACPPMRSTPAHRSRTRGRRGGSTSWTRRIRALRGARQLAPSTHEPPRRAGGRSDHVPRVAREGKVEDRRDAEVLGVGQVVGGLDERRERRVRHRGGVHVEVGQRHVVNRDLPVGRIALIEGIAHRTSTSRDSNLPPGACGGSCHLPRRRRRIHDGRRRGRCAATRHAGFGHASMPTGADCPIPHPSGMRPSTRDATSI